MSQPKENVVIMAAHNGPTGLGESHHDICGADFLPSAGKTVPIMSLLKITTPNSLSLVFVAPDWAVHFTGVLPEVSCKL